ncbi:dynamin family protein [Neobacillus sp. SAB-20_R2A]|uniref:dynamin family protein n=1 Tax=Neobacillus sp. SAB-20_R2A TaxID=3120519 RepID=UPI003C6E6159
MAKPKELKRLKKTLDSFRKLPILKGEEFEYYHQRAKFLLDQLGQQELRITVVGEFSSGKSTFLNALIGMDVLPHAVSETTATVTYIHNVKQDHPFINKMVISFFDKRDPIELDIVNDPLALKNFVTTMSSEYQVVKDVESVNLYLNFPFTDEPIVFIDTPGLNGMEEGHFDRTLSEIQRAHASIFLFQIRGLSDTTKDMYKLLTQYQHSFLYVMNFIDELKADEGETVEGKLNELKFELEKLSSNEVQNLFGISALKALAYKDANVKRLYATDMKDLTDEERKTLWKPSRFAEFEDYLWNTVILGEKQQMIESTFQHGVISLIDELSNHLQDLSSIFELNVQTGERQQLVERIEGSETRFDKNWESISQFLDSRQIDTEDMFSSKIKSDTNKLETKIREEIKKETYDSLERAIEGNKYQKLLRSDVRSLQNSYEAALWSVLEDIYQSSILKVKKFHPTVSVDSKKKLQFTFQLDEEDFNDKGIGREIDLLQTKKRNYEQEQNEAERKIISLTSEDKRLQTDKQHLDRKRSAIEREVREKQQSLGSAPAVREYYETRYKTVERHDWSPFRLFGSKYKEVSYEAKVTDTSARDEWRRQKDKIEKQFKNESAKLDVEINLYHQRKERVRQQQMENKTRLQQIERKLREMQSDLKNLEQLKKEVYEKARNEYIEVQKRQILTSIQGIIEKEIIHSLQGSIRENLDRNIQVMKPIIQSYYEKSARAYRKQLQLLLSQIDQKENTKERKQVQETIQQLTLLQNSFRKEQLV